LKGDIISAISSFYLRDNGHIRATNSPLINSYFPNTFNPSAGHYYMAGVLEKGVSEPIKFFTVDKCIRTVDLKRIGDGLHLSFFEMGVAGSINGAYSLEMCIEYFYEFCTHLLGINKDRLLFTILGEDINIGNQIIEKDKESYTILKKLGFLDRFLIPINGSSHFYLSNDKSLPVGGPRIEIYCKNENPFNPFQKYIEIATIQRGNYKVNHTKGKITLNRLPDEKLIIGVAFGIERLLMVLNRKNSIFETETFFPLVEIAIDQFGNKLVLNLFTEEIVTIADSLRTALFILDENSQLQNKERKEFLNRLIRNVLKNAKTLGVDRDEFYQKIIDKIIEIYGDRYATLKVSKVILINKIDERRKKFKK